MWGAFIIFILIHYNSVFSLQCKDHENNPVNWFVMYKLPTENHKNKLIAKGSAYIYMTSEDRNGWKLSNISIDSTKSIIATNIQPIYSNLGDVAHILYNDQPPNSRIADMFGHTKGILLASKTGGFWLVHSVPHMPVLGSFENFYPTTGYVNGQSFLCISFDLKNLNNVGLQLLYNKPAIYSYNLVDEVTSSLYNWYKAIMNKTIDEEPWYHLQSLTAINGDNFLSFAKTKRFNQDLYVGLVAPVLKANLLVETWPNERASLSSNCSENFKVNNVKVINISEADLIFNSTHDHSKWAVVSLDTLTTNWICIGDINRAEHQEKRGGGTVCFNNRTVANSFQKLIAKIEPCPTSY